MNSYTLYLDESETFTLQNGRIRTNPFFCMAGVIIADDDIEDVTNKLNALKSVIWNDYDNPEKIVLHQMLINKAEHGKLDVTEFPQYARFRKMKVRKQFYSEFKKIFLGDKITVVGSSLSEDNMNTYYGVSGRNTQDQYLVAMQLILENYCHFLCSKNARGKVLYESRESIGNESLRNKYYHMKLMGSMYMSKKAAEKHLLGMDFTEKQDNNTGLQIADFIPNGFARDCAGKAQASPNIFSTLKHYRYDGNQNLPERFGVKYMP